MKKTPLLLYFSLAFLALPLGTTFFSPLPLWFFSPFLAIAFYRLSFLQALWVSFFCGLILDLFSSQFPFGSLAFCHVITTLFCYGKKRHFFEDKALTLTLYTALISSILSFSLTFFICFPKKIIPLSFLSIVSDCIIMPFFDACYAFFLFFCPFFLWKWTKKWVHQKRFFEETSS